jgi:hypothetical protein
MLDKFRITPAMGVALVAVVIAASGAGLATASTSLPSWHKLALKNGWVYGGLNTAQPSYSKDSSGYVHLRGSVMCSSCSSATPFVLPKGYRPKVSAYLTIAVDPGGPCAAGRLLVQSNGQVALSDPSGTCVQAFSDLDGVSFPTN